MEEIEDIGLEVDYFAELEQIRDCGVELIDSIAALFDPARLSNPGLDLNKIINPESKIELEKLTQLVIDSCKQLIDSIEADFVGDLEKIDTAANKLLNEIHNLSTTALEAMPSAEAKTEKIKAIAETNSLGESDLSEPLDNSQFTILIVDDNASNRDLLSRQVLAQGYQVATAADGKQAIAMIQTGAYDSILLDIIMPGLNGYQVLKWIRGSCWRHIPTIMISALDRFDSVVKCIEMGAADYLAKPFHPTLLKARLGACLQQKRLRDRESSYLERLAKANQEISDLNNCLQAENNRLSAELEITQRLQMMLLPKEKELSQIEDLEIAGFMEPADEVGGDYYDILQHHGRLTIGIGDVTGHGLESGVLMLMVQTAVRTLMENNETDPKKFFEVLNRTIYKNVQRMNSDKNLSLCLIDYHDRVLSLSGQHEEMLVVRSGGVIERIDTIDLGFPIGLSETIEEFVFQARVCLNQGGVVVLYTDGITEAENYLGQHYGLEQLCAVVQQNWQLSAEDIRQAAIEDLRSHIGVEKVYDDITLVVLKQK
jgi:sigma-B regulation protein RsbU (phosphoserine phosphatase)